MLYLVMSNAKTSGGAEHDTAQLAQQMCTQDWMVVVLVASRKTQGPKHSKAARAVTLRVGYGEIGRLELNTS